MHAGSPSTPTKAYQLVTEEQDGKENVYQRGNWVSKGFIGFATYGPK